jgi:hypothetical protein
MFNIVQPYSGHFIDAEWLKYNDETELHEIPIPIKIKGFAGIGVSTGIKETIRVMENSRWVNKNTLKIHTIEVHDYKPMDKVRIVSEDRLYTVVKVNEDFNHINAMANLMFPNLKNKPMILYLGE